MQGSENATMLLGRILMCLLFVLGGWGKLMGPAATQAMFVKQGLPMVEAAWVLAVVVELGGGLAILFGLFVRPVAVVLRDLVRRDRADRAYQFRRPHPGNSILQEHGDDRRLPLYRDIRRRRVEPRRLAIRAPRRGRCGIGAFRTPFAGCSAV